MAPSNLLLLGLKRTVSALSRSDGMVLWSTKLPTGMGGQDFVTLLSAGDLIFAYCGGHLHALDMQTGAIRWSNELPGLGYGLASLHVPGVGSAPSTAQAQAVVAARAQVAAASTPAVM